MILSNYHLSPVNKLIQLVGRCTGGIKYINKMTIICTSDIQNEVQTFNKLLYEICSLNPKQFNRTDFTESNSTIPIKMTFLDYDLLTNVLDIRTTSKKGYKIQLHKLILKGINNNNIILDDKNNIKKFDITKRSLNSVRMYVKGDNIEARRFKNFSDSFDNFKLISQSCDVTHYNIDLAKHEYKIDEFINYIHIAWITYKC